MIVVDALDEVSSTLRVELLNKLRDLENTSIMTTSRPFDNEFGTGARVKCRVCDKQPLKIYFNCSICDDGEFDLCQECKDKKEHCKDVSHTLTEPYEEVRIDIDPTDAEIKCYAEWALEREIELGASNRHDKRLKYLNVNTTNLGDRCREDPSLKERIPSVIVDRAGGMFMLAKLYMESLKVKLSVEEVNEALSTLPGGYSDTYEMAMDRIDSSSLANPNDKSSYLARRVLTLVAFACRPLSLIELQEALAVDLQKSKFNFNTEYSKKILFDITAGLVTVDSDEKAVRLVHRTAEDYFEQNQRRLFPNVSAHIAQTLLVYLSRKEFSEPCQGYEEYEEFDARKRKNSLLSYAYQHWGDHVKKAETDVETHSAAVQFMNDSKRIAAAIQAACYLEPTDAASWDVRKGANSLHICGWFGLTGIIPEMVRQGLEIDSRDPTYGQTALMYACRRGHLSTVATCLELGASVNYRSARKSTALFEAVAENHIGIVQLLLTKKELLINIPHSGKCEQTVLMLAAQEGYVEIVDMILNRFDLKINQTDAYKETALSLAAQTEKYKETAPAVLAAIKSLLTHPYLNIDAVNQTGNSALILAARKGREDVVDLLLSKGADVSIQDREGGGTALSWAVDEGNHSMVETMFKHDVNIQGVDERGRGLLHISAGKGNTDMINLLVQKGVAINLPDRKLRTPLHEASRFNRLDSIRLLLNLGANPSLEDQARRTPLVVAWENGHIQAMKLLETKSIADFQQDSPDSYPNEEKLPIWSLAKLGRKEMINRLIIENNSDLFCCDPDIGNSALHCAVASGQVEILQTLLKAGLAPNLRNEYSRAPLHIAAMKGDKLAATILISYDAALDALDKWSFTPLYYAQHGKKFETAITLIESGAATVQLSSPVIQTLFFAAIGLNCKVAVEILIQKGADLCAKNVIGQTARQMAKEKGHLDIQQVLKANRSQYRTRTMQREDGAERVISGFPQPKDILEEEDNERT